MTLIANDLHGKIAVKTSPMAKRNVDIGGINRSVNHAFMAFMAFMALWLNQQPRHHIRRLGFHWYRNRSVNIDSSKRCCNEYKHSGFQGDTLLHNDRKNLVVLRVYSSHRIRRFPENTHQGIPATQNSSPLALHQHSTANSKPKKSTNR
jgi:hypothetical protein